MDRRQALQFAATAYSLGLIKGPQIVLLLLANHQHEGWKLSDIAKAIGASAPTVNMIKDSLVKRLLVVEQFPERDKRVVKLYLTEEGRRVAGLLWDTLRAFAGAETLLRGPIEPVDQKLGTASQTSEM